MPLAPNTKLGLYEVIGAIGAGGMGEVYRARDTKLGRDFAISLLPKASWRARLSPFIDLSLDKIRPINTLRHETIM